MIGGLRKDIDREIRAFLADIKKNYRLHTVSGLLFSGIKDFLERKGKRIRPLLFLLAYQGYTKRKHFSYKKLLRSALSFELLHDFLLAHDDVIDKAFLRRGKPALHRSFNAMLDVSPDSGLGSDLGIVAGDVIFALAVEAFLSLDEVPSRKEKALRKFIETTVFTGAGEFIDIVSGIKRIDKIRRKDVLLNYTMKTAKYTFEGPMLTGAILAGAKKDELEKISGLGISLGQAFQILDDLVDVFLTSGETGKPALSDLYESKKTLLVWKTPKELGGRDKKTFNELFDKKNKTKTDLNELKDLVKRSGSAAYCLETCSSLLKEAESKTDDLRMAKKFKQGLTLVTGDLFSQLKRLEERAGKGPV